MFDPQKRQHQIELAQNFLIKPAVARRVVALSKVSDNDQVVEIGPGHGMLTRELLKYTSHLTLIEKDRALYENLKKKYGSQPNIKILHLDVLDYRPPTEPYKVVANPPFAILSQLVKKFAFSPKAPTAMYLFMQREAWQRLRGRPMESQVSILLKTWYELRELHRFARTDFSPMPQVDVVLAGFVARQNSLVPREHAPAYVNFVSYGFQQQKATLAKNFEAVFTYEQWKRLAADGGFAVKSQPTDLTPEQWAGLFRFFMEKVAPEKQRAVNAATIATHSRLKN